MVMYGEIFHDKFKELLVNIEELKAYINNILVLNKGTFAEHGEQLRICFARIYKAGFEINSKKFIFVLK